MDERKALGQKGEAIAAKYYLDKGYRLFGHNLRCRTGELDVVVYNEATIVVVEVKTRASHSEIRPCEYVDIRKQQRIISATKFFYPQFPTGDREIRFDVVEVWMDCANSYRLHCIENAFSV